MKMKRALLGGLVVLFIATLSVGFGVGSAKAASFKEGISHGIAYMTGGVGVNERADMDRTAKDFNLKLVFAEPSKPYIADVRVEIMDKSGTKLVDTSSDGPWFFARLPEGQYKVIVEHAGKKEERTVDAGLALQTLTFVWKA
jgi:hypothetical protein